MTDADDQVPGADATPAPSAPATEVVAPAGARPVDGAGRPSRPQAAVAGALAAAVALAVATFVGALAAPGPSLVTSVGTWFIDSFAGPLKEPAVALFGDKDKAALLTGIVLISLGIGAGLGIAARRRPWIAVAGFVAFGAVGIATGLTDPLATPGAVVVATLFAVPAGLATLFGLFSVAATGSAVAAAGPAVRGTAVVTEWPTQRAATRRAFITWSGGAGVFALAAAAGGRSLAARSVAESERQLVALPQASGGTAATVAVSADNPFGVAGLSPYVTPNDSFYRIDTALVSPQVDPKDWSLTIDGMVDNPFTLTFDELLALPMIEETVTLSCVSNEVGGNLVGNAVWLGYPLADLLERAGVQPGATQIVGTSVDGWEAGFPTADALDGRVALVAVGMNGEPLPIAHGFPARLVVEGLYGYVSATKWLTKITLTTWEAFDGYWIDKGWSKEGPIKTQSRIDVPRNRAELAAGQVAVAGVAWAPDRGIAKVEVQVDDGPWQEAQLGEVASDATWRQWYLPWDATPGEHVLRVRATDGTGQTQTEELAEPAPDGATGWHTRRVVVT